jgi:hypothetical protein
MTPQRILFFATIMLAEQLRLSVSEEKLEDILFVTTTTLLPFEVAFFFRTKITNNLHKHTKN